MSMLSKIIKFCKDFEKDLILVAVIILVALISFGLGRLSKIGESKTPITIESPVDGLTGAVNNIATSTKNFVASKNGTKYHFPWCAGAQSIKEENKIWFSTAEEARQAGYQPASNCKGLK